jgi:hypothetical protein
MMRIRTAADLGSLHPRASYQTRDGSNLTALLFARLAMRTISTYRKGGRLLILPVMAVLRQQPDCTGLRT